MIVVDTNVWSESLRPKPHPAVLDWMREHHRELHMPAVVRHELRYGVLQLPDGHRRDELSALIGQMLDAMGGRVLPYGADAANAHATLRIAARKSGRTLSAEDGQILAIAAAHGASIATRNVRDFDGYGIDVIDPWR